MSLLLKNLSYCRRLLSILLAFLLTIFNTKAQTVTCPNETNLGIIKCFDIGNSSVPQIHEIPGLDEAMMPPYNIEITGILPQTSLFVEDSDIISFCESDAREITRTITIYNDDNINFTYDNGEAIETCTFTFSTEPDLEAPQYFLPYDFETTCAIGLPESFFIQQSIVADDNCPGYTAEYVDYSEDYTVGTCPAEVVIERYWTTSDLCGNIREHTQTVIIKDVTGPEFTVPADITVACGTNPMDTLITGNAANGFDECEGVEVTVTATIIEELTQENTPCPGYTSYTKRWEAVDGCNNVTTKDQIIVVNCGDSDCSTFSTNITCPVETNLGTISCSQIGDTSIPQIHEIPSLDEVIMPPYNLEITGILPQTSLLVEDSDVISFCASDAREITRTITIYNDSNINFTYDAGEEIGSCTYSFATEPVTEPPLFTAPPDIQTPCELGSGVEVTGEPILSSDACSLLSYDISFTDVAADSECYGENLLFRMWTVTDACGNESELRQEIYLFDNQGPSATIPADITVPCGTNPMDNSITGDDGYAYDVCEDAEVEIFSIIVPDLTQENTPCPGSTTYTKRWGAVDFCGNATTKDQIIVVECPPDCSNQDICLGDILADPLPGECDCQVVEYQVLGCLDPRCPNYDSNVNCDDGSCLKDFDLALVKEIYSTGPFIAGTNTSISFTITIYNQGVLAAQNIEIIDYIPASLILNDTNWTQSGVNAITNIAGPLESGELISVDINFTIDPDALANTYTNYAEIFGAQDILGDPGQDIDSTPDMNNENDYVNSPLYYSDEDDHDGVEFTLVENEPCINNNAGYFCD